MMMVKRNGNIEILRFVFSVLIIFCHFDKSVFNGELFTASYLGVEFFFMITGVFLGKKLKAKKEEYPVESFGLAAKEGAEYVWNRLCGIYPYFFLASLIAFAVRIAIGLNTADLSTALIFAGDFGIVRLFGLPAWSTTGTSWYLCALFVSLLLIYPFARKYYDSFLYLFAPLFPLFAIGISVQATGSLDATIQKVFSYVSIGFLRAIAMISVGFVVNELTDKVRELPTNRLNRFLFTACELVFYPVLFGYLVFSSKGPYDYLPIILMSAALIITMSGKSFLYGRFDNRLSMFLGKSSIILFLCHSVFVNNIRYYSDYLPAVLQNGVVTDIVLGFVLTAVTSVAVYFGGNLLRFLFRKAKDALFAPPKVRPLQ